MLIVKEGSSDSVSCIDENPNGFGGILMWLGPQKRVVATIAGIASTILPFKEVAREEAGIYLCVYTRNGINVTSNNLSVVVECN